MKKTCFLAAVFSAALFAAAAAPGADTPINLVQQADFKPVVMHGKPSAAFGWYFFDGPRYRYIRGENRYLSGEKCFRLSFENDAMTLTWSDPLEVAYTHPKYKKNPIYLATRVSWPVPPAPQYHTTGRVKFEKGEMTIAGKKIGPQSGWQEIDITGRVPFERINFTAVPGASYTFGEVKCLPVYPKIGGEIALPEGGKLTRFLLPENADYLTRWGVALWRGWLWKLTGVALPIETVKEVKPTPGAFAAMKGETAPGGWQLKVDKTGITLVYGDPRELGPAFFDYLRLGFGYAFYAADTIKLAPDGAVKRLKPIDRVAKPKFRYFHSDETRIAFSGGNYGGNRSSANDCDYYHLANPQPDHILNVILPKEIYFEKHPEYFMLDRFGKRVAVENPLQTNPCFSNKEGMETMARNLVEYAKGQSLATSITFSPGDAFTLCLCPDCVKFNGGTSSNSDSQLEFANIFIPMLLKERPDMTLARSAYASHHSLPTHVKLKVPNVGIYYCLGHDVLPCTLHVDCEMNRRCIEELKGFMKLAGSPENFGVTTYRDIRPLHHLRQMEFLNRYAKSTLHMFIWKGYSPATAFTTARWNLGEDPEKLVEEFDNVYYGKGGKYIHELNLLVDEFARNYKHTPEELNFKGFRHLCIWGGDLGTKTLLDRPTLTRIYELCDKAVAAVGNDRKARRHILCEKKFYLAEDLLRYNRASCADQKELAEFAGRLAELIRCARLEPSAFGDIIYHVPGREFVMAVAGWEIPDTGKFWADEPAVDKFLADPAVAFKPAAEKMPGGLYFKPAAFIGKRLPSYYDDQCPRRMTTGVSRPSIGRGVIETVFTLDRRPKAPLILSLEGLDDDKQGISLFKVEVNGKEIHSGPNTFPEHQWARMAWSVAPETFKVGENRVKITNITPDVPTRSERFPKNSEAAKQDSQWGWVQISEMMIFDPSGDFEAFADGAKDTVWRANTEGLKAAPGKITAGGGKVVIRSGKAPVTRLSYFRSHKFPKIAMPRDGQVRFTVTASGHGKLKLGLIGYRGYRLDKKGMQIINPSGYTPGVNHWSNYFSPEFELTAEPKEHVFIAKPWKEVVMFFPDIQLVGDGEATVTSVKVEVLQPEAKTAK